MALFELACRADTLEKLLLYRRCTSLSLWSQELIEDRRRGVKSYSSTGQRETEQEIDLEWTAARCYLEQSTLDPAPSLLATTAITRSS